MQKRLEKLLSLLKQNNFLLKCIFICQLFLNKAVNKSEGRKFQIKIILPKQKAKLDSPEFWELFSKED